MRTWRKRFDANSVAMEMMLEAMERGMQRGRRLAAKERWFARRGGWTVEKRLAWRRARQRKALVVACKRLVAWVERGKRLEMEEARRYAAAARAGREVARRRREQWE